MQNNNDFIVVELNDALIINLDNTFDFDSINFVNLNIVFVIANISKTKQAFSIANNSKTKSTFSIVVSKNDVDDENSMSTNKVDKTQKKKRVTRRVNAFKRRKQIHLLIRDLMNDEIVKNEILIKRSTNNQKKSKESKKFDNDENADNAQINRKIMFEKDMKSIDIDKTIDKSIKIDFIKTLKSKKNENNENKTIDKTIDKSIKIDFNKALKSEKDENSDELLIDIQLNKFRYHDFLFSEKLKNVEILLSFARKFDNQIFELFQRIEIILTDFDECTMSIAEKIAIDEFVETYRICRNQKTKMKITLINKRFDLVKLIIQHIDSIVKDVDRNFLNVCYVVVREKRFRSNTSIEHDVFKKY
ncbi:hypothetical protein G7Y79_00028g062310 [Physcia stellaris]|nr:hypothetical protein G7Y79_00028g062310 [Physcia stellaris]